MLFVLLVSLFFQIALISSHELECSDFPKEKKQDCEYIMDAGYTYSEEQDLLEEILNEGYEEYSLYEAPLSYDVSIPIQQSDWLENGDLILACKVIVFGLFNYIIFSFTKLNFFLKWLPAV